MVTIKYVIKDGKFLVVPSRAIEPSVSLMKELWYCFVNTDNSTAPIIAVYSKTGLLNAIYMAAAYSTDKNRDNKYKRADVRINLEDNSISISMKPDDFCNKSIINSFIINRCDTPIDLLVNGEDVEDPTDILRQFIEKNTEKKIDNVTISTDTNCARVIKVGDTVKHFKRELSKDPDKFIYKVIAFALNTETNEMMVIYSSLYNDEDHGVKVGDVFARPYNNFMGKVDKTKYQGINQTFRFELL